MMSGKRARPGPRSRERRGQLVEAAYEAMLRKGLAQLRTRDVAEAAGITVATLHYYFPTKDDLVRVVLEYAIRERIVDALHGDDLAADGLAWIRGMLDGLRRQAVAQSGHFRLLHEMIWASHADPALAALLREWHADWHEQIRQRLDTATRAGTARADLDTNATATAIMYLVFGMVLRPPLASGQEDNVIDQVEHLLTGPTN